MVVTTVSGDAESESESGRRRGGRRSSSLSDKMPVRRDLTSQFCVSDILDMLDRKIEMIENSSSPMSFLPPHLGLRLPPLVYAFC